MKKTYLLTLVFFISYFGFSISPVEKQIKSTDQIAALGLTNENLSQNENAADHFQGSTLLNLGSPSIELESSESSGFVKGILIIALIGFILLISTTIYLGKRMIDKIV